MNLESLTIFAEVMRTGSFAEVARRRDVDPSSVSRVIAGLEGEIGVRLFQRTTRRLSPTEAGRVYFRRIEPLLGEIDRAAAEARDLTASPSGTLRLTASVAFGHAVVAPLLPALRSRHPALGLELILSDSTIDLVAEGIDLAIRLGPRPDADLIGTRLMPVRHRVCVSPGYVEASGRPDTPAGLAARDCLRFPFSGYRSMWRFRRPDGPTTDVPVDGTLVISNALALRRCCLDGLGPSLLADWLVGEDLAAGRLVDLFPDHDVTATEFDTAAWLLYPSRAYVPLKVRAVIDFLKEAVRTPAAG